jgi:hypothetical protein
VSGAARGFLDFLLSRLPFYHEEFEMATSFSGMAHFTLLFPVIQPVDFKMKSIIGGVSEKYRFVVETLILT